MQERVKKLNKMKCFKIKCLALFVIGVLPTTIGAISYGQTCVADSNPQDKTVIGVIEQSPIDAPGYFGGSAREEYFTCSLGAVVTLNPNGQVQALVQDWQGLLQAFQDKIKPGKDPVRDPWFIAGYEPYLVYSISAYVGSEQVALQSVESRGFRPASAVTGNPRHVAKSEGERVRIVVRTSGQLVSSTPMTYNFQQGLRVAEVGVNYARDVGVKYYPRYLTVKDPCATAFKVNFTPNKINLGSQTTQNFHERSVPMRVEAHKDPNRGCWALSAEPNISFKVISGGTEFGPNVIRMTNGSEILIEDTSGKPVVFGIKESMGSKIGGGSDADKVQRVAKEYRLTWRKTPGETIVEDEFRVVLQADVEFK